MRRKLAAGTALVLLIGMAGFVRFERATAAVARTSARSGSWSDPATWGGGTVPLAGDSVTIAGGHVVVYDQNAPALGGVTVAAGATLEFASGQGVTLQSTQNVIVEGTLRIRPASAGVVQTLRFTGVNEAAFVGGGMDPVASDVGLWVMGAGKLDIAGTPKAGWVRAAGAVPAGATSVALDRVPSGWQSGDEVVITPTEPPTVGSAFYTGFDEAVLTSAGQTIGLSRATSRPHPVVNGRWSAEVANLSRNVLIEGEPGRKSHVFIRSSVPQVLNYAQLRHLGVEQVAGRYPVHIHMSGDGSRGTQVLGTVVRDAGHHAFVPHNSHGITFADTVAYNITSDAYWWDPPPHSECPVPQCEPSASNDISYEHALAAKVLPGGSGPSTIRNSSRLAGFELSTGSGSRVIDSTAVGVQGALNDSGFEWNEGSSSVWGFNTDNRTHNNKSDGIFDWQNSGSLHVLANFASYHNGLAGVDHGAYSNRYSFENATLYGNGRSALELHAVTGDGAATPLRFENVVFDGGGISPALVWTSDHRFDGNTRAPTLFLGSTFKNSPVAFRIGTGAQPDALDVVNATITTPTDVVFDSGSPAGNVIRLQPTTGQPTRITPAGRTNIAAFYPYSGTPPSTTTPPTTTSSTTTTTAPPTTAPPTTTTPPATTYLSQLTPTSSSNGWGPIERDTSNGSHLANDGRTITLNGMTYAKGLGTHARSDVKYSLNRQYKSFVADVGVDDECVTVGSVTFEVYRDGAKVFDSGLLTTTSARVPVLVDVTNTNELRLVVTDGGNGNACDHADWAGAALSSGGTAPTTTAPPPTSPPSTTSTTTTVPASTTTTTPANTVYLSDLVPTQASNGFGPLERDRSNGGSAAGDGTPITLNGVVFPKGLGTHAISDVHYSLGGNYKTFQTSVGIDDVCGSSGSVTFEVHVNGSAAWGTTLMRGSTATKSVSLNVTGKSELRLVVTAGGDSTACDHADWAGARLTH